MNRKFRLIVAILRIADCLAYENLEGFIAPVPDKQWLNARVCVFKCNRKRKSSARFIRGTISRFYNRSIQF